jgi:hypothetical protein
MDPFSDTYYAPETGEDEPWESYYDFEGIDWPDAGEARNPRTLQAARNRALIKQRLDNARRSAAARRGVPAPTQPVPMQRSVAPRPASTTQVQQVGAAVRNVDLENKVQGEEFGRALRGQRDRVTGAEYALALSAVVGTFVNSRFGTGAPQLVKSALPLAPLLFLKPPRGRGAQGALTDPRFMAPLLSGGIVLADHLAKTGGQPATVSFASGSLTLPRGPAQAPGVSFPLTATAFDTNNRPLPNKSFKYDSSNKSVATIDPDKGIVTPVSTGFTVITAIETVSNIQGAVYVTIT